MNTISMLRTIKNKYEGQIRKLDKKLTEIKESNENNWEKIGPKMTELDYKLQLYTLDQNRIKTENEVSKLQEELKALKSKNSSLQDQLERRQRTELYMYGSQICEYEKTLDILKKDLKQCQIDKHNIIHDKFAIAEQLRLLKQSVEKEKETKDWEMLG